jgi:hypothetical protein
LRSSCRWGARLAALPGQTIRPDAVDEQTTIRLAALKADAGASFLAIMDGAAARLRGALAAQIE